MSVYACACTLTGAGWRTCVFFVRACAYMDVRLLYYILTRTETGGSRNEN